MSAEFSVCLIVAFYFGNRDTISIENSLNCINAQIHNLNKYKHNLTSIIFVISEDNRNNIEISNSFHGKDNSQIIYFYRENKGLSFGAWIDVIKTYRDKYNYYICLEDDYYFIKNDFDKILVDEFNNDKNIGYLTTWIKTPRSRGIARGDEPLENNNYIPSKFPGGLVSTIGITSSKILSKINYFDNINYRKNNLKKGSKNIFLKLFPSVAGLSNNYNAFPFWSKAKNIIMHGKLINETNEQFFERAIISPYQLLDENFDVDINKINQLLQ